MLDLNRLAKGPAPYAFLALFLVILALPGALSMPVLDRDEARFSQASSQMLETGDFVVIRFHDGLRNKKPVGIHWLQAASVAAVSDVDERQIWAFRLPSLLGAILAAWATFWGGRTFFSARAAFSGALLLSATLLFSSEAHIAKTDAVLVGFVCLSMAALSRMRRLRLQETGLIPTTRFDAGPKLLGLIFWFAVGAGTLVKGPVAPMVPGLAILMLVVWERRRAWLKPLAFWPGPVLAILIVLPWFIAVQLATSGAFLHESVSVDLGPKLVSGAEGHSAPPGYHLTALPLLFWPATLFLLPGLVLTGIRALKPQESDTPLSPWRFLIAWAAPTWLVFEIMPTKLVHYVMPTYPALALMAGAAADALLSHARTHSPPAWARWVSAGFFLLGGIILAAIMSPWGLTALRAEGAGDFGADAARVLEIWNADWKALGAPIWPFILSLIATLATLVVFLRQNYQAAIIGLICCTLITGLSLRTVILPNQNWVIATEAALDAMEEVCALPEGRLRRESGCTEPAPALIRAISFAEPSFVFSVAGKITLSPTTTSRIPPKSQDPRPAWLIDINEKSGAEALGQIIEQAAQEGRCVRLARRFTKNYSNGDSSQLVAAVVEPGPCANAGETVVEAGVAAGQTLLPAPE